ncbi:MAG: hypothetical protein ACHQ50_06285 [Fimbriimonadales bacterium]
MSQYIVVAPDGSRFGPTDFQTLSVWAREGRVTPGMLVEDVLSRETMTASNVPGLFDRAMPQEYVQYTRPSQAATGGRGNLALILGIIGLVAWCLPIVGFPVGITAIIFGVKATKTEDRTKGQVAIILGIFCLLFSIANGIVGAIWALNNYKL